MSDQQQQEEARPVRYRVGVGEDFPVGERVRREFARGCREAHAHWEAGRDARHYGYGRGGFAIRALALLVLVAALLSAAISYPLATLGVLALLLVFGRGFSYRRRRHFEPRDWRDAA